MFLLRLTFTRELILFLFSVADVFFLKWMEVKIIKEFAAIKNVFRKILVNCLCDLIVLVDVVIFFNI